MVKFTSNQRDDLFACNKDLFRFPATHVPVMYKYTIIIIITRVWHQMYRHKRDLTHFYGTGRAPRKLPNHVSGRDARARAGSVSHARALSGEDEEPSGGGSGSGGETVAECA